MFGFSNPHYYQIYQRGKVFRDRAMRVVLLLVLIIIVPLGIKFLQKQTESAKITKPYTNLIVSSPVTTVTAGENVSVAVTLIPYNTSISVIKLVLSYDKTALDIAEPFTINTLAFPTTLVNPDYTTCSGDTCYISLTVSVGGNTANVIKQKTTIGSIVFTTLQPTPATRITVDTATEVLSADSQKPTDIQISPFVLAIHNNNQTPVSTGTPEDQSANCSYQTVCLTCPSGQLCSNFSCTRQLVCTSPSESKKQNLIPTIVPTQQVLQQSPTPTIYTTPTPPSGCDYQLVCPTCAAGSVCQQSCEMNLVCALHQ